MSELNPVFIYCRVHTLKLEVSIKLQECERRMSGCWGGSLSERVCGRGSGLGPLTPLGPKKLSANVLGVSDVTSGGWLLALLLLFTSNRDIFLEFPGSCDCGLSQIPAAARRPSTVEQDRTRSYIHFYTRGTVGLTLPFFTLLVLFQTSKALFLG